MLKYSIHVHGSCFATIIDGSSQNFGHFFSWNLISGFKDESFQAYILQAGNRWAH